MLGLNIWWYKSGGQEQGSMETSTRSYNENNDDDNDDDDDNDNGLGAY